MSKITTIQRALILPAAHYTVHTLITLLPLIILSRTANSSNQLHHSHNLIPQAFVLRIETCNSSTFVTILCSFAFTGTFLQSTPISSVSPL